MLREMLSDSSSSSDDDKDKNATDEEEEEFYYDDENEEDEQYHEENLQRELQAKLIEFSQCEAKEGASSIGKLEEKTMGWERVDGNAKD